MQDKGSQSYSNVADISTYNLQGEETQYEQGLTLRIQATGLDNAREIANQMILAGDFKGERTAPLWVTQDIIHCKKVTLSKLTLGALGKTLSLDSRNVQEKSRFSCKTNENNRVLESNYSHSQNITAGGKSLSLDEVAAPLYCTASYAEGKTAAELEIVEVEAGAVYQVTLPRNAGVFTETEGVSKPTYTALGFNKVTVTDSDLDTVIGGTYGFSEKMTFKNPRKNSSGTLKEESTLTTQSTGSFQALDSLSNVIGTVKGYLKVNLEFVGGLKTLQGGKCTEKVKKESIVSADNWHQDSKDAPWLPTQIYSSHQVKTVTETSAGSLKLQDCQVSGNISGFSTVTIAFSPEVWYHILDTSYTTSANSGQDVAYRPWPCLEDDKNQDEQSLKWSLEQYDSYWQCWERVSDPIAALQADSQYRLCIESSQQNPVSQDYGPFTISFKN